MPDIADEILSYYGAGHTPNPVAEDILMHYGVARRSGRYPYGSGDNPYQHDSMDFLGRIEGLKKEGKTESEIAEALGITDKYGKPSTSRLRAQVSIAKEERKLFQIETAKRLSEKEGLGPTEIGRQMGVPEGTVRGWLKKDDSATVSRDRETANIIKAAIEEKGMIDVGAGVERELGVSKERLNRAIYLLEAEGYPIYSGGIPQATTKGQQTNQRVICPPGTPHSEIYKYDQVHSLRDYTSDDGGQTFRQFQYPESFDSKRLKIRYNEEGGLERDGLVELRRGVEDISLGDSKYAQVRILVDGTHYIKGMAVYSDDLPEGVDIVFNTNKTQGTPMTDVLKPIKNDPTNPFGSLIKANGQREYIDKDGNKRLSVINKRADEGDWEDWQDALPSQFLGKQSRSLARKQLNLAKTDKLDEFDEICSIPNPTLKKHLLNKFADECDSAAVHLKAAALPGQKYHVMIPVNTLKDNEVYAPQYENGTKVALIRYPHAGTFEIPILTVNNRHKDSEKYIGKTSIDAVCVNKHNADRLSGADFDGDTVMVIPTHDAAGKVKIINREELKGLKGFEPKEAYAEREGMRYMTKQGTQKEMGMISNLITDMTIMGANDDDMAKAVRHSMVVIDAYKHKLDYKRSEAENDIATLKNKYQIKVREDGTIKTGGASTILSRAKGEKAVLKRQGSPIINIKGSKDYDPSRPEGALIWKTAEDVEYTVTSTNKKGETVTKTKYKQQQSTQMAEVDDAYDLVSAARNPMELIYADYANSMKSLANKARVELVNTGNLKQDKQAREIYKDEVESLNKKLDTALLNTPRERAAQRMANYIVEQKKKADPNMDKGEIKKAKQIAINESRAAVGSTSRKDRNIEITDKEWEAIQAGAISESKLKQILNNTDIDALRERATPRQTVNLSPTKVAKIKNMANSNYSLDQIAKSLGVAPSTVSKYLKGES